VVVRRIAFVLHSTAAAESTGTALALIDRLLALGHRVSVFAHDDAATLSAGDDPSARAIAALLRRGVHGAALDWVVEGEAARALGVGGNQVPGVVHGDHADLWAIVRNADIVLTPGSR
jgi:hypothetical protein